MFTGLVADVGMVSALDRDGEGASIEIRSGLGGALRAGDSVAVDGVCLTAVEVAEGSFRALAMRETLTRSSLGALTPGAPVNLELPLRAQDRLGGHIVQGHVDGTATLAAIRAEGFARVLELEAEHSLVRYLVLKGSVALSGVSLTVSGLAEDGFAVSLIPETLARTNLGQLAVGDVANVEVDILAKHVERLLGVRR